MGELFPRLRVDLGEPYGRHDLFPHGIDAVWLEIGFGSGEHSSGRPSTTATSASSTATGWRARRTGSA